jgi:nitroreductase
MACGWCRRNLFSLPEQAAGALVAQEEIPMNTSVSLVEADDEQLVDRSRDLVRQRYRRDDAPAPPAWTETLDVLLNHRSVRAYLPDPLAEGTVETLVAAAQSAASSSNLQVWSVVAVEDPERKARLAALAGNQKHIIEAPLLLVWLIDFDRLTQLGRADGVRSEALDYTETFLLGAVDTSLAAQSAVTALESLGLGSVYIGGIRNKPAEVAAELNLPPHVFALFGLVVGKPDPARPTAVKPRLPQASVLFREQYKWGEARALAAIDYNPAIRAFQREQGMAEKDWTVQARERTRGPSSMAGRHVLRDVLRKLGFELR